MENSASDNTRQRFHASSLTNPRGDWPVLFTRRYFCSHVLLTSTGLVLVTKGVNTWAAGVTQVAYPPMRIVGAERVLPGSYLHFNYPEAHAPAILVRTQDGEYSAYSRKCAHLGCSVDFDAARRCLSCPCHKGAYDAKTGFVLFGPPIKPLDSIILQVRAGGEIWAVGKTFGTTDHKAD
jgi:Rieske Fe-S protein